MPPALTRCQSKISVDFFSSKALLQSLFPRVTSKTHLKTNLSSVKSKRFSLKWKRNSHVCGIGCLESKLASPPCVYTLDLVIELTGIKDNYVVSNFPQINNVHPLLKSSSAKAIPAVRSHESTFAMMERAEEEFQNLTGNAQIKLDQLLFEDAASVEYRESMRRKKIGQANKGRVPWNKGRKHTPETIALIRERTTQALQDPEVKKKLVQRKKIVPWNKGRKHTPETIALIRERTTQALQDPEVKKKLVQRRLPHRERMRRKKIGQANKGRVPWNKGRKHTLETIALIPERTTQALQDPKVKKKLVQRKKIVPWNKGRKHTPETIALIRERTTQALQDPEVKKKLVQRRLPHSDSTKARIGASVKMRYYQLHDRKLLQQTCIHEWGESIAEAARRGGNGDDELNWNSYELLKAEMKQELLLATTKSTAKMEIKHSCKRVGQSDRHKLKISQAMKAK